MRILFIGNFTPPYEEENLHNFTLLTQLKQEGHECNVINIEDISEVQASAASINKGIVFVKNYLEFIIRLFQYGYKCNVIHFLTKGYTRPGLMKMVTAVFSGKIMLKKIVITLHPEMFSIFGQLRSKMGGQQLLNLSFSMANKIICGDKHTYEVASSHYSDKNKFTVIPPFFHIPEDTETSRLDLIKIDSNKKIIVFSGVTYPSLIFDVLNDLLTKYLDPETGIVVSIDEQQTKHLQDVLEKADSKLTDRVSFIWPTDAHLLSIAYAKANLVIRTLSCDCKSLFNDVATIVKKPRRSDNYLYFPSSLLLIKEGETSDLIAYTINKLLVEKSGGFSSDTEEYYKKIAEIYKI